MTETVPPTLSGAENTAISLAAIAVSDSPNTADILATVLTVSHGTVTVGTPAGIVSNNGTDSVTLTGTAAQINAALATTSYTASLNYFGSDSLAVTTTDTNNGASSGTTESAAITISNSTAVTETVPPTLSGAENTAISLAAIAASDSPNTADILATVLTVSHGTVTVGTPAGIVSNNGTDSVTLTGTAAQINAALATTSYTASLNYSAATASPSPPPTPTTAPAPAPSPPPSPSAIPPP